MANRHNTHNEREVSVVFREDNLRKFPSLVSDRASHGHPINEIIVSGTTLKVKEDTLTEVRKTIEERMPELRTVRLLWNTELPTLENGTGTILRVKDGLLEKLSKIINQRMPKRKKFQLLWDAEPMSQKYETMELETPEIREQRQGFDREIRTTRTLWLLRLLQIRAPYDSATQDMSTRIDTLEIDRVTWGLFHPKYRELRLSIFPFLTHLKLTFEPEASKKADLQSGYELGKILRSCRGLKILHLHFGDTFRPGVAYLKFQTRLPPNFEELVERTHYKDLEELSLKHVTLDHDFAVDFFERHVTKLKTIDLCSLWNNPNIVGDNTPLRATLVRMRLQSIQLRGRWTEFVEIGDSVWYEYKIWEEWNGRDLREMIAYERDILGRGTSYDASQARETYTPVVAYEQPERSTRKRQGLWERTRSWMRPSSGDGNNIKDHATA